MLWPPAEKRLAPYRGGRKKKSKDAAPLQIGFVCISGCMVEDHKCASKQAK